MIERLLQDHQKIRQNAATFLVLVSRPEPCDPDILADRRWALARLILQHLPVEERHLYRHLENAHDPAVVALADASRHRLEKLYGRLRQHTETWQAGTIDRDWPTYCMQTSALMGELIDRINEEEAELYPQLERVAHIGTERRPTDRNWAGNSHLIKANLMAPAASLECDQ